MEQPFQLLHDKVVFDFKGQIHHEHKFSSDIFDENSSEQLVTPLNHYAEVKISVWPVIKYHLIVMPILFILLYLDNKSLFTIEGGKFILHFIAITTIIHFITYIKFRLKSPFFIITPQHLITKKIKLEWNQVISIYHESGGRDLSEFMFIHYIDELGGNLKSSTVHMNYANIKTQEIVDLFRLHYKYGHVVYYEYYPTRHFPM